MLRVNSEGGSKEALLFPGVFVRSHAKAVGSLLYDITSSMFGHSSHSSPHTCVLTGAKYFISLSGGDRQCRQLPLCVQNFDRAAKRQLSFSKVMTVEQLTHFSTADLKERVGTTGPDRSPFESNLSIFSAVGTEMFSSIHLPNILWFGSHPLDHMCQS